MLKIRKAMVALIGAFALLLSIAPALAQTPTEVKMWIAFGDYRCDWAREKAAAFNEVFPQYNVVVDCYDNYEVLFAAAALAFEQGSQPAIIQYFEAATQNALDARKPDGTPQFKPIVEAIGDRSEINGLSPDFDDIVDAVRDYYTIDGEFASMPWNTSSAIMFSNQEMLEAAGVTEIPDTWAEVEAACEAVLAMPNAPRNCISWPNHGWFFEQSVGQQGADLVNNGNGRLDRATETFIAGEAGLAYVSWWKEITDKGYYIYTGVQRDWNGVSNVFLAQDVAMIIHSSSDTTTITNGAAENGFTAVASFMPHNGEVGYAGNLIGGATLWLTDGLAPEVEDGALTWLIWFNNTENAAEWHQITGYIAIRKSSVELLESQGWFDEFPNARVAGDQLAAATPSTATAGAIVGGFPAIRNEVTGAIEAVLVNNVDVTEAMTEAQTKANNILEEYNLLNVE